MGSRGFPNPGTAQGRARCPFPPGLTRLCRCCPAASSCGGGGAGRARRGRSGTAAGTRPWTLPAPPSRSDAERRRRQEEAGPGRGERGVAIAINGVVPGEGRGQRAEQPKWECGRGRGRGQTETQPMRRAGPRAWSHSGRGYEWKSSRTHESINFINQLYWRVASTSNPLPQHISTSRNTSPRGAPRPCPAAFGLEQLPWPRKRRGVPAPHKSWSLGQLGKGGWRAGVAPLPPRDCLWLVALCFHVVQAQLFVLLKGALVALHAQLRVLFGGIHVLWGQGESSCTPLCPQARAPVQAVGPGQQPSEAPTEPAGLSATCSCPELQREPHSQHVPGK